MLDPAFPCFADQTTTGKTSKGASFGVNAQKGTTSSDGQRSSLAECGVFDRMLCVQGHLDPKPAEPATILAGLSRNAMLVTKKDTVI